MIYFIRDKTGRIKIGTTRRLSARLSTIKTEDRKSLEVLGVMGGGNVKENELHRMFAPSRLDGEWFEATPGLTDFIASHARPWDGKDELPEVEIAKLPASVLRDARIIVAVTGEGLSEYLSRVLEPIVARDKAEAIAREQKPAKR